MTHTNVATEVAIYRRVRDELAQVFGMDTDDPVVIDTTEGETDLIDVLTKLMREARVAKAHADGTAGLIKEMQDRKARLEARASKIRTIVLNAMCEAELPKITAPDFTVSRSRGQPSVVIEDETQVPDEFCRIVREPRKKDIADALKSGMSLPFARLSNAADILTVRGS